MKKNKFKEHDLSVSGILTRGELRSILAGKVKLAGRGCGGSICRQHSHCSSGLEVVNPDGYCRTCVVYNTALGYGFCGGSPI
ncbi:hypothetical protein CMU12_16850 [Elizabethkingia anophelis]|nr:hypothetical protein [Elizabethkingia anophelis]